MPGRCIVGGCSNTSKDGVSMHTFPKDVALRKIWTARVKLTRAKWYGPTDSSVICSAHFDESAFQTGLYSQFGLSRLRRLTAEAIPSKIKNKSVADGAEKPERKAFKKRQQKQMVDELLANHTNPCTSSEDHLLDKDTVDINVPDSLPGCSQLTENMTTQVVNSGPATSSIGCQTECQTEPIKQSIGTQTKATATRVKRIQASVTTAEKGLWAKPNQTSTGISCKIPDNNLLKQHEERYDEDDIEIDIPEKPESPGYLPDSSGSSTDCSTPKKKSKKPTKRKRGLSPRTIVDNAPSRSIPPQDERKYIVFESQLLKLFKTCSSCGSGVVQIFQRESGTLLTMWMECGSCSSEGEKWDSQPCLGNIPAGNVLLSAATLFSGGSCTSTLRLLQHLNVASITERTFYRHQTRFLQPAIEKEWKKERKQIKRQLLNDGKPLIIGGDGRADSPGHSAKFGTYTAIDLISNKIVDIQLVQSNEVKGSYHMELEGYKRMTKYVKKSGLTIEKLVTDRHRQLAKYIREKSPEILHMYDVWHVAKSVKKKVRALSQRKGFDEVHKWGRSINNHVYWVASSTTDEEEEMREHKWLSIGNHLQGVHEGHSDIFPRCLHGDLQRLQEGTQKRKEWLKSGTEPCAKLTEMLSNTMLLKDIRKMSSSVQTSSLESFHSVLNHFAPKSKAYSYYGMISRIHLAALHFNANAERKQAITRTGKKRFALSKPKYKEGAATVKPKKEPMNFAYVAPLMNKVAKLSAKSALPPTRKKAPPTLCSRYTYPAKEELIKQHRSRFSLT